ncbi:MAG: hypothetical protein KC413_10060, partial [Anaerolineales bacterium]|nr:hypothetical protein [Anaerolineales bacterium]
NATVILPDAGVELTNDGWAEQTQQTMGGMFLSYARQNLPAGSTLTVQLEGEPQEIASTTGSSVAAPRNQTLELAIGGVALAAVLGGAYFVIRGRQTADDEDEYEEEEEDALVGNGRNADELIQLIAELDNAFANGDIDEADYQAQRADLKAELKAIW